MYIQIEDLYDFTYLKNGLVIPNLMAKAKMIIQIVNLMMMSQLYKV